MKDDWERCTAPDGRVYFQNHTTQATQWEAPEGFVEPPPAYDAAEPVAVPVADAPRPGDVHVTSRPGFAPRLVVATARPTAQPVVAARPAAQPVATAQPVVVSSQEVARPVVVASTEVAPPAPVVVSSTEVAPPPPPRRGGRGARSSGSSGSSGAVAYEPPRIPAPVTDAEKPARRRSSASAAFGRAATLTKTAVVGKACPARLKKTGVLTLDGRARFVRLEKGSLTIYEASNVARANDEKIIFRAPIKFLKVVGYKPRDAPQPTEIKLFVEPQALNQEHNRQNSGGGLGMGWHPMNLRVGRQERMDGYTGDVRRQNFSLFAKDQTEKHSWHTTLNTVCNSAREWAYVSHEVKDTMAYLSGKKR